LILQLILRRIKKKVFLKIYRSFQGYAFTKSPSKPKNIKFLLKLKEYQKDMSINKAQFQHLKWESNERNSSLPHENHQCHHFAAH